MQEIKVLIVEDDSQISKSLSVGLSFDGFKVATAENLSTARGLMASAETDIILLDINLPDGNGLDFCEEIRASGNQVPVLFLSARTDEETVVKGMNIGADDYLRKPFGMEELKVRMKNALKRSAVSEASSGQAIEVADLKIDLAKRTAIYNSKIMTLSRREFDILVVLSRKPGEVVSREQIAEFLGDGNEFDDRTIDSHISHLRKKLRDVAVENMQIIPVYGVGYRLHWVK